MITLRPMRADEFAGYVAFFVPDYTAEIIASYGRSLVDALIQAQNDIAEDLPQGPDTPGQSLMCIDADQHVGYLWYRVDAAIKSAFINDICVLPQHQNKGYGTATLAALEALLKPQGITQIRLRVAAKNSPAHSLYSKLGFFPTGINMAKTIGSA
jgi:ribosomal protein S18 acetylase RimI-like enzyme